MTSAKRNRNFERTAASALSAAAAVLGWSLPAAGVEVTAGDWKLNVSGSVNVHYIRADCEDESEPPITGGLACRSSAGVEESSSISNGLVPAALSIGASTTQNGYDLGVTFGLFPGISTNDGSANLQQGASLLNTPLGTSAIDVRQVFLTFGNDKLGTFKLGRDIGLFGSDAILNDMSIPGVGGVNGNNAAPANTALGSIGLGYIYADWFGQIDYTTRDFNGLKVTLGIFDPLEPIGQGGPTPKSSPGLQGKISFAREHFYVSGSVISQQQEGLTNAGDFRSSGFDVGGKIMFGGAELLAWYYQGSGIGTTALYLFGATPAGQERDSDGFLAQFTYKAGATKYGVNYGQSNLDLAANEPASALVERNEKYTLGVYHSLTANLTVLGEFTRVKSRSHDGIDNNSSNFNVGAYLSF